MCLFKICPCVGYTPISSSLLFLHHKKKDGDIFVDPSPYTINLLIAYDEITYCFCFKVTKHKKWCHISTLFVEHRVFVPALSG